jgi:hypothetical protein
MSAITVSNVVESVKCDALTVTYCTWTIEPKPAVAEPVHFGPNGLTEKGETAMQVAVKTNWKLAMLPVPSEVVRVALENKPEHWTIKENVIHNPTQVEPKNLTLCVGNTGYEVIIERPVCENFFCLVTTRYIEGDTIGRKVNELCTKEMLIDVINGAERRIAKWYEFNPILKSMSFTAHNEGQYELLIEDETIRIQVVPSLFPTCECCMVFRRTVDTDKRLDTQDWEAHTPIMFKEMMAKILQNPYEMSF